jgi:dipeptidase E
MKFYLSSYKLGNEENIEKFKSMFAQTNKLTACISNALDYSTDITRREKGKMENMKILAEIGLKPEIFDLRNFFDKKKELKEALKKYDLLWVRGGNAFVLRQAMHLSGFDEFLIESTKQNEPLIYSGYSAGVCVLGPTLKGLATADDPTQKPYGDYETIWEGLNILDYLILPHYKSNHPESADIDKDVEFCKSQNIPFKTLSDGEVIIIE